MQRVWDIVFSGVALLLLSPLLLPVMIILRLTGEGEVLFRQERVGRNGKPFWLLKFATMLKESPNMGAGTITLKDDPRVLPFGRFLRNTKINELPQLVNVLKGDMSLVGPRPQTQRCFAAFPASSQSAISQVRPGLSGVGSVVFREEEDMIDCASDPDAFYDEVIMPYKGNLEEWYVRNQSVGVYFALIGLTACAVVFNTVRLLWWWFPDLPAPPEELRRYI